MRKLYTDKQGHTRSYEHTEPLSEGAMLAIVVIVVICLLALLVYGMYLIREF